VLLDPVFHENNAEKYTAGEQRTPRARIRAAAKARKMALPHPDDFVELMDRVWKKRR
jgi:hypothetical protein